MIRMIKWLFIDDAPGWLAAIVWGLCAAWRTCRGRSGDMGDDVMGYLPEPTDWQNRYHRAGVMVGHTLFVARAPRHLAFACHRTCLIDAQRDADEIDAIFSRCPQGQWGSAALAANNLRTQEQGCRE